MKGLKQKDSTNNFIKALKTKTSVFFEESEILREIVLTLEQELSASRQIAEDYYEQMEFSNKHLQVCNNELLLLTKEMHNLKKLLQFEQKARRCLEQKLLKPTGTVNSLKQEKQDCSNGLKAKTVKFEVSAKIKSKHIKTRAEFVRIRLS